MCGCRSGVEKKLVSFTVCQQDTVYQSTRRKIPQDLNLEAQYWS
jgi:hypothetical protein